MHDRHRHESAPSKLEQDERSVTKWLNTMEASLARPDQKFSMAEFTPREIRAINSYMATHERSLGRYEQFLPPVRIQGTSDRSQGHGAVDQRIADRNSPAAERNRAAADRNSPAAERNRVATERTNRPQARNGNVEQDERAVTKWLNTMEASLANPDQPFSMDKFSRREVQAINAYIATRERSLGRYEQFLPQSRVNQRADRNSLAPSERPNWS